ncbi:MAG: hypothetical protein SXA11_03475 [Cyanobacteriota bacterium]|nr:hypothetical protein [Cyanobacteriota bacterium]
MITKELTQTALDRLLTINWRADDSRIDSHVALFQEYLRRMSLWAKTLDCQNLWPFFDVAAQISSSVEVSDEALAQLKEHLANFRLRKNIKQTCEWYLRWGAIADTTTVQKLDLPAPYEPLILMYERGATFYTEHGFFCVSLASFPMKNWSDYHSLKSVVELDDSALDILDSSNVDIYE